MESLSREMEVGMRTDKLATIYTIDSNDVREFCVHCGGEGCLECKMTGLVPASCQYCLRQKHEDDDRLVLVFREKKGSVLVHRACITEVI